MRPSRHLPLLACAALALAAAGCGDDGPTTTSAAPSAAMQAQGARGGTATATAPSPGPLSGYAGDGEPASDADADPVRAGFRAFAQAVLDRDASAACARVTGFEALLRARGLRGTCRTLLPDVVNTSAGPSARDLTLIDGADVVVDGDRATVSVGSAAPVPMRREAGTWKLDYAAFAAAPRGG